MIFITGGCYQGKTEAAMEKAGSVFKRDREELSVLDGREENRPEEIGERLCSAQVILHLEGLIRCLMEAGREPEPLTEAMLRENREAVVTADEIGCGVVPLEAFEREYRERAGRIFQQTARAAEEVYRVILGIEMRIK